MKNVNESILKYLAGYFDADGCAVPVFAKQSNGVFNFYLRVTITASANIDLGYRNLIALRDACGGIGNIVHAAQADNPNWSPTATWTISKKEELESFIPQVAKHMVIKGTQFMNLLELRRSLAGVPLTLDDVKRLKVECAVYRRASGPIRPKKFPTPAWLAGLVDGDGSLVCEYQDAKNYWRMRLTLALHTNDSHALEFIARTHGGAIYDHGQHAKRLDIGLGFSQRGKIDSLLRPLTKHLRLKKHRAEIILHRHSQRLSESKPKG